MRSGVNKYSVCSIPLIAICVDAAQSVPDEMITVPRWVRK